MGYFHRYMQGKQANQQRRLRSALRWTGWLLLIAAGVLVIIGIRVLSDDSPFGLGRSGPSWELIFGIPMLGVALACLRGGYLGLMTEYVAGEVTPPVSDSIKYIASELRPVVQAVVLPPRPLAVAAPEFQTAPDELTQRLKRLEVLRSKKLISEGEYTQKREEILKEL